MGHSADLLIIACLVTLIQLPLLTGRGIVVVLEPKELLVMEGGVAKFWCSPYIPIARPLLFRNGYILSQRNWDDRISYTDWSASAPGTGGNRTYSLTGATLQDHGSVFHCSVAGYISDAMVLSVFVPLAVSGVQSRTILLEGESSEIAFKVHKRSYPIFLRWLYNEVPFPGSDAVQLLSKAGALQVLRANTAIEGNYTLVLTSPYQTVRVSTVIEVISRHFDQSPVHTTLVSGHTATMRCRHDSAAAYLWRGHSALLRHSNSKVKIDRQGTRLVYGPVDYRDHLLEIECVVLLPNGRQFSSPPAQLSVLAAPVVEAVTKDPLTVVEGQKVILVFRVHSYPPPISLIFYHNKEGVGNGLEELGVALQVVGEASKEVGVALQVVGGAPGVVAGSLEVVSRFSMGVVGVVSGEEGVASYKVDGWERSMLCLSSIRRQEGGAYSLVAVNEHGRGSYSVEVIVKYPPIITPFLTSQVAQVKHPITLSCGQHISSSPPPSFKWTHSSAPLPLNAAILAGGFLHIASIRYEDGGHYTCTVTNVLGADNTDVVLLVLDPASPPENITLLSAGPTWAHLKWSLPTTTGSRAVSSYTIKATPSASVPLLPTHTFPYPSHPSSPSSSSLHFLSPEALLLSTCVEVFCPSTEFNTSGPTSHSANLTHLIPAVEYVVTMSTFSNGTRLQSKPSDPLSFTTMTDTPAAGSVWVTALAPGSITVEWTLAYSGGLPLTYFSLLLCRCSHGSTNCTHCLPSSFLAVGNETVQTLTGFDRRAVVGGVEAAEWFVVQISPENELGEGAAVVSAPILSHSTGVPGPPQQPQVRAWAWSSVTIATSLEKLGSMRDLLLTVLSIRNGSVTARRSFPSSQTEGDRIEVTLLNVSYHPQLQFFAFATNYYGSSQNSSLSLMGHQTVEEVILSFEPVSVVLAVMVAVFNSGLLLVALGFCYLSIRDNILQRRELERRKKIADIIYAPASIHVSSLNGTRSSLDKNSIKGTSCGLSCVFPCSDCDVHIPGLCLSSNASPITEV